MSLNSTDLEIIREKTLQAIPRTADYYVIELKIKNIFAPFIKTLKSEEEIEKEKRAYKRLSKEEKDFQKRKLEALGSPW